MICQVGIDFVVGGGLDGLVQLAFGRSDPVLEDDPNAWCHLTLLMAWSLKLVLCLRRQPRSTMVSRSLPSSSHPASSILETAPSHPKAIDWDYVKPILHGERLTRQARYLRRLLNERQLALLQVGLRFFREALRALEFLVLGQNSPPWVQLAQGELFRHQDVLSIFRLILQTGCSRFSLQSLGVLMEVNHLMLKLLKRFCDQRGHMFVSRPLTKTILAGERGGGGFDDGYDVGAASHETDGPEREFHFIDLLEEYAHEAIIDKFTRLLQNATGANEIGTNRYLAIMLNHFVSGELQGACTLLFRASLLEASHSVLYYSDRRWRQANAVLVKVCQLLASRFVAQLRERPLLAVAIFFNLHHLLKGRQPPPDASMASDEAEQGVKDGISLPEHWQREERIAWLVRTLVEAEFSSAISWLTGKLFDAAAERAPTPGKASEETSAWPETGTEGGALPRTTPYYVYAQNDSIKEALGDPTFKALLCACGLEAPSRGERNWRVPVEMRLDDTLRVAQQLQSALRLAIDIGGEETLEWDKDQRTATKDENDNHGDTDDDRNSDDQGSDQLSEIPTTLVSDSTAGMFGESKGHLVRDKSKRPAGRWAQLKQSNFFLSARPLSSEEENSPTDDLHEQSDAGDDGKSTTHRKMNLSMDEDYDREAVLTDGDAPNPSREGEPKPKKPPLAIYSDSDE